MHLAQLMRAALLIALLIPIALFLMHLAPSRVSSLRERFALVAANMRTEFGEAVIERPKPGELREALLEEGDKLRELREKSAEERGATYNDEVHEARERIYSLDAELAALVRAAEVERAEARVGELPEGRGPLAALLDVAGRGEHRSAGALVTDNEEYRSFVANGAGGKSIDFEVRALLSTESSDPAAGLFMPRGTPFLPATSVDRLRLFVRDLISTGQTTLNSIPYIRELNPRTNEWGATSVAEGAAKPEVTTQFSSQDAPVRKVAAWIPVTTEIIEDAPTLRTYIDARLAYMVALREEQQVLNGSGTAPQIRGIRQQSGLQTQTFVSGDVAATLGLAIGKIEAVDGMADGVAINPTDYWTAITSRHANQFDAGFGIGLPFGPAPETMWGLRCVRTRSMETGKALVGSYKLGAQLFDRQQTVIRVGDQHSDYFTNNKVAVLAEERIALAVYRPDWFVEAATA